MLVMMVFNKRKIKKLKKKSLNLKDTLKIVDGHQIYRRQKNAYNVHDFESFGYT